jgi:ATP-dependent Clp protease protease subunit
LFDQRIVLVRGVVDRGAATLLSSALLALDAAAQRPITLHLDSPAAELTPALLLADTIDALRVSVHAVVIGELGGGAVAILAAADHRQAHRHAHIRLSEPHDGGAHLGGEFAAPEQHDALLGDFVRLLAEVTGRPAEQIAGDLRAGRDLRASDAVDYGLLDPLTPGGGERTG